MRRLVILALFVAIAALSSNAQVAVIVNKSVNVTSLDHAMISDIYQLNTKFWDDGTAIKVFWLREPRSIETEFAVYLGMKPLDLRKIWLRQQLSGEGKAPTTLPSDDVMIATVASTPGAVGFIETDKVTSAVRVVAILK
jgi:ABC-type phosphate transport system substrate-binding protein